VSTWYCDQYWPIVDDRLWWSWSNWWIEDWQGKPKYSEKTLLDLYRFFSFLIFHTVHKTLWKGDQPIARPLPAHTHTVQHRHRINAYRHPCLKWNSNPRSSVLARRERVYASDSAATMIGVFFYYYYGSTALCLALVAFLVSWSYTQSVGLLGRGISLSQGLYLHTE
jgi:hypothetical protein